MIFPFASKPTRMGKKEILKKKGSDKMKHMRKLFAVLLAVMMVMGLATTAFAADATHSITITGTDDGHTYTAYQILDGTIQDSKLIEIEWGSAFSDKGAAVLAALKADTTIGSLFTNAKTAEDVADIISASTFTAAQLEIFANIVSDNCTTSAGSVKTTGASGTIDVSSTGDGYYLVKDTGTIATGHAQTQIILKVLGKESITVKGDAPTSEKKVKDKDDTANTTTDWQDSADYDIGDDVPFQLKATLPTTGFEQYKSYKLTFHDTLSSGLTLKEETIKVYVDGSEITTGFTKNTSPSDNCTFEIVFADVKTVTGVKAGSVITVEYDATLNENAVTGTTGNKNKMHISYSNNPNQDASGNPSEGSTPDDTVIVFTYKVIIDKVDQNKDPLAGATFTLYKKVNGAEVEITRLTKNTAGTQFTFTGLDDGDYVLKETPPQGYNPIDDIEFTISATHNSNLSTLTASVTKGSTSITFTSDATAGSLSTTVENKQGATLPETGGIGTTMFYVLGGVLVLAAVVLLVTKKRMSTAE